MATRCTAEQFAEAVALWSTRVGGEPQVCRVKEDADYLKPLDLVLSTVDIFRYGYEEKFEVAFRKHKEQFLFKKKNFIDYLERGCLLLAQKNECFNLFLTCSFVAGALHGISGENSCCHLSRVSCKLLTKVLEDKFAETFNTDSGWEKLMSFCRKIHDSVLPSEANRPVGPFVPYTDSENENSQTIDETDSECSEQLLKFNLSHRKDLEFSYNEQDADFLGQTITTEKEEKKSHDSPVIKEASDTESSDDEIFWYPSFMKRSSIWKKIYDSPEHLMDIRNLLKKFEQEMESEKISPHQYEITVSDEEEMEKLEKGTFNLDISDCKIKISECAMLSLARIKCEEEKNGSDKSSHCSEEFTDAERLEALEGNDEPSKKDPQCELCYLKMYPFKTKWLQSFKEKYSNCEFVSEFLDIHNKRVSY